MIFGSSSCTLAVLDVLEEIDIKVRHIEVFYALMKSSSMTEASERLHVSQPAVSSVLKHAEQSLRLKLFQRVRGRLVPTPEALALLPEVEDIFKRLEALGRSAEALQNSSAGTISIAAAPAVASFFLPAVIRSFTAQRPKAHIVLRVLPTSQVQASVRERKSDFGIVYQPGVDHDATLQGEPLRSAHIVCVMPRDHILASRTFVGPEELTSQPLVTFGAPSQLSEQIHGAFAEAGQAMNVTIESSSSLASIFLVASGLGLALVESTGMLDAFPNLVEREFRPLIETRILLLHRSDRPKSRVATAFQEHLRDSLDIRS